MLKISKVRGLLSSPITLAFRKPVAKLKRNISARCVGNSAHLVLSMLHIRRSAFAFGGTEMQFVNDHVSRRA